MSDRGRRFVSIPSINALASADEFWPATGISDARNVRFHERAGWVSRSARGIGSATKCQTSIVEDQWWSIATSRSFVVRGSELCDMNSQSSSRSGEAAKRNS